MRDNVISLVVVTAGGRVVRTRSRARKSSAGYDLTRLLVGSEGTLGVIVEATLRVRPTPEAMSAAVIAFPELHAAVECVVDVLAALVPVARIELLDALQVEGTNRLLGLDHVVAPTLFLELHGTAEEVERELGEVRAIAKDHGAARIEVAADETARRRLWRARHQAYPAARALRPGTHGYVTDVCVPVSELAACITEARAHLDELGLIAPMVGHVGDGNFHVVMLIDPDDPDELRRAREFSDRLARRAIELDGTCTGEHGVGYGKTRYLEAEHGADGVALMRAIKGALDPDGLLNPGKVLP